MNREEQIKKWQRLIAKAWMDEDFKKRLAAEPAKVMAEEGLAVPEGVEIKVVEDTDQVRHFLLPKKPEGDNIENIEERLAAHGSATWS